MRIIGVLDLRDGIAVHARGGRRESYGPVRSRLLAYPGDAVSLVRLYREMLDLRDLYVADLDALATGRPQRTIVRAVARAFAGATPRGIGNERRPAVLVDGGIAAPEQARATLEDGATRAVVALETLRSLDDLEPIVRAVGADRVTFSLDLRSGHPVGRAAAPDATPAAIAARAVAAGVGSLLVVDLARVGSGAGADVALATALRAAHPEVELLAGGGVRDRRDLERLADAGVDGALVGTALHEGRLTREDVAALRDRRRDG